MKTSVIRVPDDVLHRAEEVAVTLGITRTELIVRTLRIYIGCQDVDGATGLPVSDTNGSV